jgi:hypothetical protein
MSTPPTAPLDLERLRELLAANGTIPWGVEHDADYPDVRHIVEVRDDDVEPQSIAMHVERDDAKLIAEMRNTLPALLNELEAGRRDRERLEAQLATWEEREAACCPEDVGFDEYIAALQRARERLLEAMQRVCDESVLDTASVVKSAMMLVIGVARAAQEGT